MMEDFNIYTRERLITLLTETPEKLKGATTASMFLHTDLIGVRRELAWLKNTLNINGEFREKGIPYNVRVSTEDTRGSWIEVEIPETGYYTDEQLKALVPANREE